MGYKVSLWVMAALYILAGGNHFWHPAMYISIMPRLFPASSFGILVSISGIFELACGLLLLPASTRRFAAWAIIALLIAVFPANIQMAADFWERHDPYTWLALLRLPVQGVLIWWA